MVVTNKMITFATEIRNGSEDNFKTIQLWHFTLYNFTTIKRVET